MRLDGITPLLITYNEEANLPRVLERLGWARRIVVIDSHSTDATPDILAAHPAVEVFERPFRSFADQCNFGLTRIETEWVLSLDADYVLTDGFLDELAQLDARAAGYSARFTYCVDGKGLRGSLYPPRTVLFRRAKGRYVVDGHAHKLQLDGETAALRSKILHDDRKPLSTWLDAQRRYARQEAAKLREAAGLGRAAGLREADGLRTAGRFQGAAALSLVDRLRLKKWLVPILTPLYCLFRKGLILDGPAGWRYTAERTYAEILMCLYLSEPYASGLDRETAWRDSHPARPDNEAARRDSHTAKEDRAGAQPGRAAEPNRDDDQPDRDDTSPGRNAALPHGEATRPDNEAALPEGNDALPDGSDAPQAADRPDIPQKQNSLSSRAA